MANHRFQHTRSTGKMHTYDVEMSGQTWDIRLKGKLLRSSTPIVNKGSIRGEEAARVHAISAIEYLQGMAEE